MSTDFMHCEGKNCPLKEMCLRYEAHTSADGDRHFYFEPHKVGNDCEAFVNKNSYEG